MTDIFVLINDNIAFAGFDCKWNYLVIEFAGLLCSLSFVLRCKGEFILHITTDLPLLGNVFGRLTHVISVKRIPQTITDHTVDVVHVAHFMAGPQMCHMGRQGHVFLSACAYDRRITQLNMLRSQGDGTQTRTTHLVNTPCGRFNR